MLVLHPTETVVSLTGDPCREDAARRAREVKGYADPRPFLCLVPDEDAARRLAAEWPAAAARLAASFWPGPLTLVLPAAPVAPDPVAAGGTIALRPASDPVSRALLAAWRGPLFSTSANVRGQPPPTAAGEAARALEGAGAGRIALALVPAGEKASGEGVPSTVVDVTGAPRIVRPGAIPLERLREVVPEIAPAV